VKKLTQMTTEELISYWVGRLLIEIGRGKFREAVGTMLLTTMSESYTRGQRTGKRGTEGGNR
jgi:hypothetical protein